MLRKRLENYWYYYKWHTIAVSFLVVFLIICAVQCSSQVPPDVLIQFAGAKDLFLADARTDVQKCFDEMMKRLENGGDCNRDKKNILAFREYSFDVTDTESPVTNLQKKFENDLTNDRSYLYMMDEQTYQRYSGMGYFAPITKVLGISPEQLPDYCLYDDYTIRLHFLAMPFAFVELVGRSIIDGRPFGIAELPSDTLICIKNIAPDDGTLQNAEKYTYYSNCVEYLRTMIFYPDIVTDP